VSRDPARELPGPPEETWDEGFGGAGGDPGDGSGSGAVAGGLGVALATKAIPRMMDRMAEH
jgi:hypothetical protein